MLSAGRIISCSAAAAAGYDKCNSRSCIVHNEGATTSAAITVTATIGHNSLLTD
jgi:hypothetical protein